MRRCLSLISRILNRFQPQVLTRHPMPIVGAIAQSKYAISRGAHGCINANAVTAGQTSSFGQFSIWNHADANDHKLGGQCLTRSQSDRRNPPPGSVETVNPCFRENANAAIDQPASHMVGYRFCNGAAKRAHQRLYNRNLATTGRKRRRYLQPNKTGANDNDLLRIGCSAANDASVRQCAQRKDIVQAFCLGQKARSRARRKNERIIVERRVIFEMNSPRRRINTTDCPPQIQPDVMAGIENLAAKRLRLRRLVLDEGF